MAHRGITTAVALVGSGLLFALTGCTSGASDVEDSATSGTVNLLSYSTVFQDQYEKAVIEPFQEKYPDITINYVGKRGSADMLSALQAEGSNPTTDVALMDVAVGLTGNTTGIFDKLSEEDIPNLKNVEPQFQDKNGYGPVATADAVALMYDAEKVSDKPTSWNALWDDQFAQQVTLNAPPSGLGINLTAIISSMEGEDFTKSIDKSIAKLKELAPNVQSWAPIPDEYQTIMTGQSEIGVGQNARGQFYSDQSNGKLGLSIPEEGTVYQLNTINLVKNSPNKEAAKTFINYALSGEAQRAFAEALYYAPTVTDADLPEDVADRVVKTDGSDKIIDIDQEWLSTVRQDWTDRWKREVTNAG